MHRYWHTNRYANTQIATDRQRYLTAAPAGGNIFITSCSHKSDAICACLFDCGSGCSFKNCYSSGYFQVWMPSMTSTLAPSSCMDSKELLVHFDRIWLLSMLIWLWIGCIWHLDHGIAPAFLVPKLADFTVILTSWVRPIRENFNWPSLVTTFWHSW